MPRRQQSVGFINVQSSIFTVVEQIAAAERPVRLEPPEMPSRSEPVTSRGSMISIASRVQAHTPLVILTLTATAPESLLGLAGGEQWKRLATCAYTPSCTGRVLVTEMMGNDATKGPDLPDAMEPLQLQAGISYTAHVYAVGRESAMERYDEAMGREEWGAAIGFETYQILFCATEQK